MTAFVEWDDTLALGIDEIDTQHQALVSYINKLHDAMLSRKSNDILGDIINELVKYTQNHFRTEEKYFILFEYPKTSVHKRQHLNFVKEVEQFKSDFENGKLMMSMKIMNFLKDWLVNHIQGSDREYTPLFKQNGL